MSTSASGRVIDEHNAGIAGLNVIVEDVSQQFDVPLDAQTTDAQGAFVLSYIQYKFEPATPGRQVRKLRFRVRIGQHVLHEILREDLPTDDRIVFPDIRVTQEEAHGWWATLGT